MTGERWLVAGGRPERPRAARRKREARAYCLFQKINKAAVSQSHSHKPATSSGRAKQGESKHNYSVSYSVVWLADDGDDAASRPAAC
jgi:hypothetical protein